jgi:4-alpha-glucanotransferase
MKVLLFAFGEDMSTNPYAPHNHIRNCVIYTGTHDNSIRSAQPYQKLRHLHRHS